MIGNAMELFYGSDTVRVIDRDGQLWFIAKDVCDVLGIKNPSDAVRKMLDDDEYTLVSPNIENIHTSADRSVPPLRPLLAVSESGLYSLVFRSTKPNAKRFTRWVTHEVVPTIRKTGGAYIDPSSALAATLDTNPDAALDELSAVLESAKAARAARGMPHTSGVISRRSSRQDG
ncbi:kilA domain protein [Mycobacteroides abscessus 5S-0422]|uniref:BRO family, N-terminal domain protein n=1 Tax=Mycobacteroides abscessus subsp. bolletii 1513 TaxID=1299321 RepID=X8DST0_9MYCO|nr:BRO family protein [Mycobacteroides abscessus]EUA71081.1 BRO family, N-terminal domain protein [Mycobacteroides abscessus subsp. bolletii 1513]EIU04268.1 kilA domain protein [Mycobacteroides abscessus 5S-0422]EIU07390.1 kilA domain protein [Mycobacteroides abscessus 5S-0421]EIU10951.1 kilA domain protein [Mycobacteroides abscessus 5S-0304]EIU21573.1 kilA domain protein [Mycobacteroides abscessus 5S-0708]